MWVCAGARIWAPRVLASHDGTPHPRPQIKGREAALRDALTAADPEGCGLLGDAALEAALSAAGLRCTRHQVIACRRAADRERRGGLAPEDVLALVGL